MVEECGKVLPLRSWKGRQLEIEERLKFYKRAFLFIKSVLITRYHILFLNVNQTCMYRDLIVYFILFYFLSIFY